MLHVQATEGQLVVFAGPVMSGRGQVREGVVHPSEVPFEVETEASGLVEAACDAGPSGRLLRAHDDAGVRLLDAAIHLAQQRDGLQVGVPAVLVRKPLALFAHEVAVQHRGDGIHPDAIDVVPLDPEQRRSQEVGAHLVPAEVEDAGSPLLVLALARILILVRRRTIVVHQGPLVLAEMRGHKVHDDADAGVVHGVHKKLEIVRRAKPRVASIVASDLVAPRAVKGVVGERQQLQVVEVQRLHVLGKHWRDVAVIQKLALSCAAPRRKVHLVDRHRLPPQAVAL
mmetsp:Transcript_101961/g.285787  ORF Transcript_101961/g.285787 Transcript_101961/m.285787 type:complete len:284 (+) Transcript_101961:979-1830(+)